MAIPVPWNDREKTVWPGLRRNDHFAPREYTWGEKRK